MKKSLLLIALLVISVSAFAAAPNFPDIPDLKLLVSEGLSSAFDLECFNTGDQATAYNVTTNFLGKTSLVGSVVAEDAFGSATVGNNAYSASNEGGTGTATNKVKWSTYRIAKLPKVGLSVGATATVNLTSFVSPSIPASFGNAQALIVSDTTKVSAAWNGTDKVDITLLAAASSPVDVFVIASPDATPGVDQDKEVIAVYTNLLTTGSGFATSGDIASSVWGTEIPRAGNTLMAISWSSTVSDAAGTAASGVEVLSGDANTSYKGTNLVGAVSYLPGQWYTTRAKYFASGAAVTGSQLQMWNFSNIVDGVKHIDLAVNIDYALSTTWSWLEIPMYSNQSGTGYAQIQVKPSGAVVINIDEVQILNAAPSLISAVRGCDKFGYAQGKFTSASDISTGWSVEAYNAGNPTIASSAVAGGVLSFTFGTSVSGAKLTAASGPGVVVTPSANIGKDAGVKVDVNFTSGSFSNTAGIFVSYIYGVSTNGGLNFYTDGQLVGAAEFTGVTNGTHYAIAPAEKAYNQFQFAIKGNQVANVAVDNADFIRDNDDPYYGEASLFP